MTVLRDILNRLSKTSKYSGAAIFGVCGTFSTDLMIAEGVWTFLHLVPTPPEGIATSFTLAASPSALQLFKTASSGGATWRNQTASCRTRVVMVDRLQRIIVSPITWGLRLMVSSISGSLAEFIVDGEVDWSMTTVSVVMMHVVVPTHAL